MLLNSEVNAHHVKAINKICIEFVVDMNCFGVLFAIF